MRKTPAHGSKEAPVGKKTIEGDWFDPDIRDQVNDAARDRGLSAPFDTDEDERR